MKTAEKKLGCLAGTMRANMETIGTITGDINVTESMPKGGSKQVSLDKEGNVMFWCVNDFDVIVTPEDIVDCELLGSGRYIKSGGNIKNGDETIRVYIYGTQFKLTFANGKTGTLGVNVFAIAGNDVWKPGFGQYPKVDGWLAPNGARDEHYNDAICPEGYTPNIEGYYKGAQIKNQLSTIDKKLKLSERFPDAFDSVGNPKGLYTLDGGRSIFYVKK